MTKTKALLFVLFILAVSAAFADYKVFQLTNRQNGDERSTTAALCSFKEDLQRRVDTGHAFLEAHPNGIPGIPASTLRLSVFNAQRTLTALKPLRC